MILVSAPKFETHCYTAQKKIYYDTYINMKKPFQCGMNFTTFAIFAFTPAIET